MMSGISRRGVQPRIIRFRDLRVDLRNWKQIWGLTDETIDDRAHGSLIVDFEEALARRQAHEASVSTPG
jgi:hypothetical protein